ncbi:Poly [ADP-ribose] polymerase 6 [Tritrichomonas musculus]|uniref:Poly [ADP-ribose] polymerase n=1 Tax=Tritrichomonas musculus TaxID=1915356 RepID=A0ABR2IMR9_9EUKA
MSEGENTPDSQIQDDQYINEEEEEVNENNDELNDGEDFNNYDDFNNDEENNGGESNDDFNNDEENNDEENFNDFETQDCETQELDAQEFDDDDLSGIFSQTESQNYFSLPMQKLNSIVNTYSAYIYQFPATLVETTISLQIPRVILPLSLQAVCGFLDNDTLLEITMILDNYDWSKKPASLTIQHPTKKDKYVGYPLVQTACKDFFTPTYKPREFYRSYSYLLTPSGQADAEKAKQLINMGFDESRSKNALVLCDNDLNRAIQFLKTGDLPSQLNLVKIDYEECPLLYFVLEICECFLDLQDHCCICRKQIPAGLKPTICDSKMCTFQFTQIGVGFSVVQEIQRDPLAADLIFSIFSTAIGSKYFSPRPPDSNDDCLLSIADTLPAMDTLAKYSNDSELGKQIGQPSLELLRWVLLSNRSQMISLDPKMRFPIFGSSYQFLSLISSPQAEKTFKVLKEKHGSMYLFHGSNAENWHSILRNGLKNASGTSMMAHGNAYGSGIYFAHESSVSQGYAPTGSNKYSKSRLGKNLQILALCEIAKVDELSHHGWAHTLTREEACIVRFLLVNGSYNTDVEKNPPKNVPKLKDVLNMKAELKFNQRYYNPSTSKKKS